jgi:putative phosphoribosyl transferase
MVFENRRDAGRLLADLLLPLAEERPIVLALPRGGVPVAVEVARALDAPLDLLTVRKLGAPENPELGMGAVAEDGTAVVDTVMARRIGMTQEDFDRILDSELRELGRRIERFRDGRPPLDVRDRTVILVDDGLATGLTDLAAVRALRRRGAGRIVVAVPVGSREAVAMLRGAADEVVCHTIPRDLVGVGRWYRDFSQVSDDEVLALLAEAGVPVPPPAADPPAGEPAGQLMIDLGSVRLYGDLAVPPDAHGLVIFSHGSGSSRLSPRNRMVARRLEDAGLATLLFDLLAEHEEGRRDLVFDIPLLAGRLDAVTSWARQSPSTRGLPIGYFGASTGAAAALRAAAALGDGVRAVVSRGGRPDMAADRLPEVRAATLLIVGSLDRDVLELNRRAAELLRCPHRVEVVEGAGHLFEEPGTLEAVAGLAIHWFLAHLPATALPLTGAAGV